ncbi:protein LIAT1 [Salminus brasiliensis]|uniref:protein LIAT1 n=1 Tax=Salminus brasiliensis TaxID=930266 RepID=UPI003B82EDC9
MLSYTMATLAAHSTVSETVENPSTARKGQHIPKEGKKKRRNAKAKEKNAPTSELKKRGHPSTPSHSDDSEKPQAEEWTKTENSHEPNHTRGHTKERGTRKSRKCKTTPPAVQENPVPPEEGKTELSSQVQESLRWEGVLEDPAAEMKRLEVYRANRRKRYMASRQTLSENVQVGLGPNIDVYQSDRVQKAGAAAKHL